MTTENKKRPEWVRKKISEGKKGIPASEYSKRRASETHKGKIVSEETKAKQSAAHKGKKVSPEAKAKSAASRRKPVKCLNTKTGEVIYFPSVKEVAEFLNLKQVEYARYKCRENGVLKDWQLSYENKN